MSDTAIITGIDARGVATITLNRPRKHNAFDDEVIGRLTREFERLAGDDTVRAMLLTAHGESFSAGADLNWMRRMAGYSHAENLADARALAAMLRRLNDMPMPTIARVQGAAFGGAVGLVSCCDVAVGGPAARFALSEVRVGLIPATISPYVIAAIGARAARRYFLTGEQFDADTALRLGLLTSVVPADGLDEAVDTIVERILANGPVAVRAAKRLVFEVAGKPLSDSLIEATSERIATIRGSAEGREGVQAFLEKRPPAWRDEPGSR